MPIDPKAQRLLQQLAELNIPPLSTLEPVEARELSAKFRGRLLKPKTPPTVENLTIPGPEEEIPVRIYTPEGNSPFPLLVYFHGGGWVVGDLDAVDNTCRALCLGAGCMVISVDYRLAPEYKFPAALEDAYAAIQWLAANASGMGGDATRLAVAGDSAGGNLAAAVALMARDKGELSLSYQLLIYPVTHCYFDTESYLTYGEGDYGLRRDEMIWFWQHYLADEAEGKNPYASPLLAEDLSGLPPALIVTAECDILRDEAEAYAASLKAAGVSVQLWRVKGMIHNFVSMAQVLHQGKDAIAYISAQLRQAFAT